MNIDDVMPWIVVPLVLLFLIRSIIKKTKGGGGRNDRHHDPLHDNLHDDHDFGGSDSGDSGSDD
jgi:hypothetical protein